MCEINLSRFTVTFTHCTDSFYLPLTDYMYHIKYDYRINNQCHSDIGKTL